MRILIKTASGYMDRYEYVLKDYNPTYIEDEKYGWGGKRAIIEAESISDLKELSEKLKQDLIIANPYDEYHIPTGVQADLSITIYDDYIE